MAQVGAQGTFNVRVPHVNPASAGWAVRMATTKPATNWSSFFIRLSQSIDARKINM
jgi:cyclophilin family peptidyl-prolyl cis-trans isomerase